jgi:predicted nucleic acid-binding Zn ribbon protein
MTEVTPTPVPTRHRCPRCGAPVNPDARFCAVCGTETPAASPRREAGRRGWGLLVGSSAVLLLIFAAVAWIYFSSPERRAERPVSRLPDGAPGALALLPGRPPTALATSGGKLLVSPDRGSTWQAVALDGAVGAVGGSEIAPGVAYLAGGHFWRGDARGFEVVGTDVPSSDVRALAVDPSAPQRVYAVVAGSSLFRSDDGGRTWVRHGSDVPADATSLTLAGPTTFFLGTAGHGVFASADGRAWSNASGFVNGALPTRVVTSIAVDAASGDRYVAPSGETLTGAVYVGTDRGVFKSIDGGRSWAAMPLHRPVVAVAVDPSGSRLMLAVDPNGQVYRSDDGGNDW